MPGRWWSNLHAFLGRYVISLGVVGALTVAGIAAVNRDINHRVAHIERIKLELAPAPAEGANYLILGSDTRAFVDNPTEAQQFGDANAVGGQRSDTLMVAHVEPGARRTFIVSFPRDLLVRIPGVGSRKINSAFDEGGPQKVIDTLTVNYQIPINHFVQIDFKSFREIVDAIGKVGVYFPLPTRDYDQAQVGDTGFQVPAGCQMLNGESALAYVRSRHLQTLDPAKGWGSIDANAPDLNRIKRQQDFIRELAGLAIQQSLGDPLVAVNVADGLLQYLKADQDLSRGDVNALIRAFRTVDVNDTSSLEFATIPTKPNPADPLSTLVTADGAADVLTRLRTFGANTAPPPSILPSQVQVQVLSGAPRWSADAVASELAKQGFRSTAAGDDPRGKVAVSEVQYGPNAVAQAKALLDYVDDAKLVPNPKLADRVVLVIGESFRALTVPSVPTTTAAPSSTGPGGSSTTRPVTTTRPPATTAPPAKASPAPAAAPLTLGSACS